MDQIQSLGLTYNPKRPTEREVLEYFEDVYSIKYGMDYVIPFMDFSNVLIFSNSRVEMDFAGIIKLWNSKSGFEYITEFI